MVTRGEKAKVKPHSRFTDTPTPETETEARFEVIGMPQKAKQNSRSPDTKRVQPTADDDQLVTTGDINQTHKAFEARLLTLYREKTQEVEQGTGQQIQDLINDINRNVSNRLDKLEADMGDTSFDRAVDASVIGVNAETPVLRTSVIEFVKTLAGEAELTEDNFQEYTTRPGVPSKYFTVRLGGCARTATLRANKMLLLLRRGFSPWRAAHHTVAHADRATLRQECLPESCDARKPRDGLVDFTIVCTLTHAWLTSARSPGPTVLPRPFYDVPRSDKHDRPMKCQVFCRATLPRRHQNDPPTQHTEDPWMTWELGLTTPPRLSSFASEVEAPHILAPADREICRHEGLDFQTRLMGDRLAVAALFHRSNLAAALPGPRALARARVAPLLSRGGV